jgi:CheY-like chemotaxis protein
VPKILIVDDEPIVLSFLHAIFADADYDARLASNEQEAKALCQSERFDIVLSDVMMPGANGYELAEWIAENHPATRTLLMTGFDMDHRNCPDKRGHRMLSKPFAPDQILAAVADALAPEGQEGYCVWP